MKNQTMSYRKKMCGFLYFHIVFWCYRFYPEKEKFVSNFGCFIWHAASIPLCKDIPPWTITCVESVCYFTSWLRLYSTSASGKSYIFTISSILWCFPGFFCFQKYNFLVSFKTLLPTPKNESIIINQKWNFSFVYYPRQENTRSREKGELCWFEDMPSRPDAIPLSTATSHSFFSMTSRAAPM